MFSSKPVQRTTDPVLLRQKAIEFLNKHYTLLKPSDAIPNNFYMLEPLSINGMKKVSTLESQRRHDKQKGILKMSRPVVRYNRLSDGQEELLFNDLTLTNNDMKWYRPFGIGNSASDAVLGGTRRRKSRRRQRKSRRR